MALAPLQGSHEEKDVDFSVDDDDAGQDKERMQAEEVENQELLQQQEQQQKEEDRVGVDTLPTMVRLPKPDGREGWVYSGEVAQHAIAKVLAWREEVTQGHCATAGPGPYILSFDQQTQIQHLRFRVWKEGPENHDKVKTVEQRHQGVSHRITRDLASMHRVACKDAFGGIEWTNCLLPWAGSTTL